MPNNESTLELQLPPKPYCEWQEGRIRYRITRDADGGGFSVFRRLPFSKEWQYLPWVPHCLTVAFGALAWGREVKRLVCEHNSVYGEFTRNRSDALADAVGEAARNVMNAHAQEAAWRERAAGSEKGAAK